MTKKSHNRSWWKKQADIWFSRYIRERDKGQCYTCNNKNDPKKMQCGHFNPRQYLATRYNEINNHCQCYACNLLYAGQAATYAKNLIRDYGPDIIEKLEKNRWIPVIDMNYEEIAHTYQIKYESLTKQNEL